MWRVDSLEKTLMLGGIGGRRRRGWQRMRWLDGITDLMDMSLGKLGVGDGQGGLACCDSRGLKESDTTEWLNWTEEEEEMSELLSLPCEDTPQNWHLQARRTVLTRSPIYQHLDLRLQPPYLCETVCSLSPAVYGILLPQPGHTKIHLKWHVLLSCSRQSKIPTAPLCLQLFPKLRATWALVQRMNAQLWPGCLDSPALEQTMAPNIPAPTRPLSCAYQAHGKQWVWHLDVWT